MQKINKITLLFSEILEICYFGELMVGMLDHTQLKLHDNTVASMDVLLHATNKITQLFPRILVLCYFAESWTYLGMPYQQILHDLTKASMDI